jgi:hypothetical protein
VSTVFITSLPDSGMQEIITGERPFREISFGPAMIIAVVQDHRTPEVPELLATPTSPRAVIMYGVLHRCWRYDPKERATAREVKTLVSWRSHRFTQSLISVADADTWHGLGTSISSDVHRVEAPGKRQGAGSDFKIHKHQICR